MSDELVPNEPAAWAGMNGVMESNGEPLRASSVPVPTGISPEDARHLESYARKTMMIRDRTAAVARGYQTGLFLWGPGGVGKSHTVIETLREMQAHVVLFNARMTGRGLFNALAQYPDAVHVLEDMEPLMRDGGAMGVLRSALWGTRRHGASGPMERIVTWTTHRMEHSMVFTGGLVIVANKEPPQNPEWDAIRTRIACLHLQPTEAEIRAMMRRMALNGYQHDGRHLDPAVCGEVCEFTIRESLAMHRTLDLRLLVNALQDYLLWEEGDSVCHWFDLVAARLRERPTFFRVAVDVATGRADIKRRDQLIAREIMELTANRDERMRLWAARTGKSEKALYRRMAEIRGE